MNPPLLLKERALSPGPGVLFHAEKMSATRQNAMNSIRAYLQNFTVRSALSPKVISFPRSGSVV